MLNRTKFGLQRQQTQCSQQKWAVNTHIYTQWNVTTIHFRIPLFWNVPVSPGGPWCFKQISNFLRQGFKVLQGPWTLEEEGNFPQNVRNHLPSDRMLHPRRPESLITHLWQPAHSQSVHLLPLCKWILFLQQKIIIISPYTFNKLPSSMFKLPASNRPYTRDI